jgi:hypothetical protein
MKRINTNCRKGKQNEKRRKKEIDLCKKELSNTNCRKDK